MFHFFTGVVAANTIDVSDGRPRLPRNIAELTAEWLGIALSSCYPGVEVTSVHFGTLMHGSNTKVRLLLTYNEAGHSYRLPPTMMAKCGFEVHSRQVAECARSEVVFYRERAPEGLVNAPKCYFAGFDEESGSSFLLLEDLLARNVTFGSAPRPVDPLTARLALEMLSRYHARWWNSPLLASLGPAGGAIVTDDVSGFILDADNFEHCMHLPRAVYVPPHLRDYECFRSALLRLWESNARGPHCMLHGDFHLGNCFFEVDGTPGFLDWQGDTHGCWAHDFAEFLLTALDIDARRSYERPLLEFYLERLRYYGVENPPGFETAWRQYRRNTLWVAYASAACPVAMQPEAILTVTTQRGMAAVMDLDALASLEE